MQRSSDVAGRAIAFVEHVGAISAGLAAILGAIGLLAGLVARLDGPYVVAITMLMLGLGLITGHAIVSWRHEPPSATVTNAFARSDFKDERIRLTDLIGGGVVLSKKSFENCEIVGPAVVYFVRSTFFDITVKGGRQIEDLFWQRKVGDNLIGAIRVESCIFRECTFEMIGVAGSEKDTEAWATTALSLQPVHPPMGPSASPTGSEATNDSPPKRGAADTGLSNRKPLTIRERSEKLRNEMTEAMGTYDAMTVARQHEVNAYFQPYVVEFRKLQEELQRAGHMPTFEVVGLVHADWDYLPTRGDAGAIVDYLGGIKWRDMDSESAG